MEGVCLVLGPKAQRQKRTGSHRTPGKQLEAIRYAAGVDDRVAPVVEFDYLG